LILFLLISRKAFLNLQILLNSSHENFSIKRGGL
jgi:hypothetical protein